MFVFIHGSGCTGSVFAAQSAAFPGSYAMDLPGHRTPPLSSISIGAYADEVERDLEARGIEGAVLCGSSMGGAIALEVGLRANPRVGAIVMLGSGSKLRVAPALLESLERDFEAGARGVVPMFFAAPTPALIDASVAQMLEVGQAQTIADFRACDAFDATDRLAGLALPLLALTGEQDRLTPPKFAAFLADRVPGAEARILPEAGHLAMVERPDETNAALRAFVDRLTR
ncbi:MAG TPA: alpha/beta fold hydrolase [Candidatus Acidoferrales bacterium]|nr:alpha/beta fold hydrolase [Candidatus Acidoferrales bacterium]